MALYDYTRIRKKQPEYSVIRVSYQKSYKSIYFNLPDEFQYIIRFTFVTPDVEKTIREKNALLRNLINKKADRAHIPMHGARFVSIHNNGYVVYNIVLDKLLSAIWLFSQLVEVDNIAEFSWLKRERKGMTPIEYVNNFNRCKQNFFVEVSNIFRDYKDVTKIEVDCISLNIHSTGHEPRDFDPQRLAAFYTGKPRYRAYQTFGRLSKNSKPTLK